MISVFNLGELIQTVGEVMVGMMAVMVHRRFWMEHSINEKVWHEMRIEQYVGLFGIILIVVGYLLRFL